MQVQEMDAESVPSLIFSYPAPAVHMFYARMAAIKYLVGQWNKDVVLFFSLSLQVKMRLAGLIQTFICSRMRILNEKHRDTQITVEMTVKKNLNSSQMFII